MKSSQQKQKGATLISWMIGISVGILIISAGLKIGPNYLEYHSVKTLMNDIAAEPGIEKRNKREIMTRVEKYLNINSLNSLEKAYYSGKSNKPGAKKPFTIVKLKKSNKRELAVHYESIQPWLGNISFLMDHKYSVELGKPQK